MELSKQKKREKDEAKSKKRVSFFMCGWNARSLIKITRSKIS